jgi:P27 family predicted phage terminase small subunit
MGRRPIPTAIKRCRGTLRKRDRKAAPAPSTWPPLGNDVPDWLAPDAAEVYVRVVKLLAGTLTAGDEFALSRYASLLCHWRRAHQTLADEGPTLTVKTMSGPAVEKQHPAARLLTSIAAELRAIEDRFGMNAASRRKLAAPEPADPTAAAESKFFPSVIPLPNGA